MRIIGQVMAGTLGFILLWTHLAFSSQSLSNYNLLQGVTVDRKGGELLIQLKFKNPPVHFQDLKFFKKSIQMDFPLAYVNPSKRYFDTGDDRVQQVYVSQFDPKLLRLRLMLAPGASIRKDDTVVEQVGRMLRIRIHQSAPATSIKSKVSDPLESLLARASRIHQSNTIKTKTTSGQLPKPDLPKSSPKTSQPMKEVSLASSTKKSEGTSLLLSQVLGQGLKDEQPKKKSSSELPALKTKKAGMLNFDNDPSTGKPDLFSASLKMASTLGLVLGLMFVIFHLFKKFGLKNSVFGGGEGKPIKVLSTGFLAPRKSIALVEVAGDVLVVGISNDQISLLANVQDPEKIEQIKNTVSKKNRKQKAVASPPKPDDEVVPVQAEEGGKPSVQKQGVDIYNKRLVKSGSTNPFGEYVKQFSSSSDAEQSAIKDVASRVRKTMGEVPIIK